MPSMTTSKSMFRVEDVTLKHPRRQSEVEKEIAKEHGVSPAAVPVPVSMTPESIKTFLTKRSENTTDFDERKIYSLLTTWIDELFDLRKKVVALEAKLQKEVDEENKVE